MAAFSVRLLQLQQVAENPSLEQGEFLCACHSDKQGLSFLNKDPQNHVLFNWSGLSGLHAQQLVSDDRWTSFFNLCQWISAQGVQVTDCRRNRVIEETRQKCKYIVKICFVTAFLALANVLIQIERSNPHAILRACSEVWPGCVYGQPQHRGKTSTRAPGWAFTVSEVGSKLTTLFTYLIFSFSESESESWFDGF